VRTLLFACPRRDPTPRRLPLPYRLTADRADLREKLRVGGGGVAFTTIQEFMPAEQGDRNAVLSDRRRRPASRGRTRAARTRPVFGDYISIYDIARAVEDGATVPIYYEGPLAKLELSEAERPKIDPDFEEVTEGEEVERKEGLKSKWAQLGAVVGSEKRLRLVAAVSTAGTPAR
jgi:type I restriction enzyme R subunit